MHERIIEYINSHEGVEWMTMEEMVAEFKEGKFQGALAGGVSNLGDHSHYNLSGANVEGYEWAS